MIAVTRSLPRSRATVLAALFTFALAGAAQAVTAPSDAWITTKVKLSLATTDGVSASDVNVDTVGRQVTLHGIVNTPAEKLAAEQTAKAVNGVESVRNLLQVVPEQREAKVEAKDADIERDVKAALAKESSLEGSSISVQSVNNGVVILKGSAQTMSDELTAVRIARSVPGTRQVTSQIESNDQVADKKIWKDEPARPAAGTEAKAEAETKGSIGQAADSAGGAASDLYITSKVKMKLLADSETPAMDINVDTQDGAVTLFGMVPTAEAKAAAEAKARETRGVTGVKNQLQVVASEKQPEVKANDEVVADNLKQRLEKRSELGAVDIEVKNCVARLTGTVPSGIERVEALQVARATSGVCAVKDDLTVQ